MSLYFNPVLKTLSSETLLVKLQSSGAEITPLECDTDVNCGAADLGGECAADFFGQGQTCGGSGVCGGASAQFFLQGSIQANPPTCTLFVNGQPSSDCDGGNQFEEASFVEACAEGAIWQMNCIGSYDCEGSDNIVVQCDGQSGTLSDSCGFVALKD